MDEPRDEYLLSDFANKTFVVPEGAVGITGYPFHWVMKDGSEVPLGEAEKS